jgi:DNA-binding transcriptional MerR regulator
MSDRYTIGRLARAASVAPSAIRYYERIRLLEAGGRTEGNYRFYGEEDLQRLRFIRAAQSHGFTLRDIGAMLDFRDGRTAPCGEVQALIEERLADLDRQLERLHRVRDVLRDSLRVCRRARRRSGRCRVIEDLRGGAARGSPLGRRRGHR